MTIKEAWMAWERLENKVIAGHASDCAFVRGAGSRADPSECDCGVYEAEKQAHEAFVKLRDLVVGKTPVKVPVESEFVHAGFLCRRVIGNKLGRRGNARTKYGWLILDKDSLKEIDRLMPNADSGVSRKAVERRAEQLREMDALKRRNTK